MVSPGEPTTIGTNKNHFQKITVNSSSFPTIAQTIIRFRGPRHIHLSIESGDPVEYSFNGNHVAGDLNTAEPSAQRDLGVRGEGRIWFRLASGSSGVVRVEAWAV